MAKASGRYLVKNAFLMQMIMDAYQAGDSISAIARRFKVGRETIKAALARPEAEQFEKVTAGHLQRIIQKQLARYEQELDKGKKGKINVNSLPVSASVFIDKRTGLLNDTKGLQPDEQGVTINSILDDLKNINVPVQVNVQVNVSGSSPTKPTTDAFDPKV